MDYLTIKLIRERMREKHITQQYLAETIGVSVATVNHWLAQRRTPTLDNYFLLLDLLDLEVEVRKVA